MDDNRPDGRRFWCLDRREPVFPGDPLCADPNCDAHREREQQRLAPYDLPIPPKLDWGKLADGALNWVREIAERAKKK